MINLAVTGIIRVRLEARSPDTGNAYAALVFEPLRADQPLAARENWPLRMDPEGLGVSGHTILMVESPSTAREPNAGVWLLNMPMEATAWMGAQEFEKIPATEHWSKRDPWWWITVWSVTDGGGDGRTDAATVFEITVADVYRTADMAFPRGDGSHGTMTEFRPQPEGTVDFLLSTEVVPREMVPPAGSLPATP